MMCIRNFFRMVLFTALSFSSLLKAEEVININQGWRFCAGDQAGYADPGFDDSKWISIKVDSIWENQGFAKLDGFAWYRLRLVIPSRLKEKAYLKEGLRLFLGKINNFDQSFLNGKIFGANGRLVPPQSQPDDSFIKADSSLWNLERCYVLPLNDPRILWDKENVLAVRVYDEGGDGGLYTGDQSIRMISVKDQTVLDYASQPFVFKENRFIKIIHLANRSVSHVFLGTFTIQARGKLTGKDLYMQRTDVILQPGEKAPFTVSLENQDQAVILDYTIDHTPNQEKWDFREYCPYILTPSTDNKPRINGALIYGGRPNRPFQYGMAVSGVRPMMFEAENLPAGLVFDDQTGIIHGRVNRKGTYEVKLRARNSQGEDSKILRIVIGDGISLTPPLGWNSWNCWGLSVDADKVLASARVFKEKGLQDHGWSFINIDDGWEIKGDDPRPKRNQDGQILTNEKFKDMKALSDQIHQMGLKLGIYSSPGPLTCGGYTGSYQFEFKDAGIFARWGIDYLKYDWCSYGKIAPDESLSWLKKPYILMRRALDSVDRDIVYSLCQYGMGQVWKWGKDVGGNLWRTTGDIEDTWKSMKTIGFAQVENAPYAGPGHWNDPDMLVVGWVGWGPNLHPTRLTPDEQYTHISLWCLLSAPLLIGCDLERLDPFTLNLLTNDEVLAIDQDILGRQAVPCLKKELIQGWVKELQDGAKAVGIFNLGDENESFFVNLTEIGIDKPARIRDLWRQKDLSNPSPNFQIQIPSHGVILLKIWSQK